MNSNIDDRFLCCYCCCFLFVCLVKRNPETAIYCCCCVAAYIRFEFDLSHKSPHVLMLLNFCHQIRIWHIPVFFFCLPSINCRSRRSPSRCLCYNIARSTFFSTNFLHLYNFRRIILIIYR